MLTHTVCLHLSVYCFVAPWVMFSVTPSASSEILSARDSGKFLTLGWSVCVVFSVVPWSSCGAFAVWQYRLWSGEMIQTDYRMFCSVLSHPLPGSAQDQTNDWTLSWGSSTATMKWHFPVLSGQITSWVACITSLMCGNVHSNTNNLMSLCNSSWDLSKIINFKLSFKKKNDQHEFQWY